MALGRRDKASRLRRNENSPTAERGRLQARLDCSPEETGKGICSYPGSLQCLGQGQQLQEKRGREAGKGRRKGGWKRIMFMNSRS